MLMTFADDERGLWIVGGLGYSAQSKASFQSPRCRCVAPEELRRERRRKSRRAVIAVIYQNDCTRHN
jgi:hypothetical protein